MGTDKDLFTSMLQAAAGHYSREALLRALDFVASLDEQMVLDWVAGLPAADKERVLRVWKATRG